MRTDAPRSARRAERVRAQDKRADCRSAADAGAGTVSALGAATTVLGLALLLAPVADIAVVRHRVAAAADAAALAAADVVSGLAAGEPCATAARVAAAGGASLPRCEVDGLVVTVAAAAATAFGQIAVAATAGPPA